MTGYEAERIQALERCSGLQAAEAKKGQSAPSTARNGGLLSPELHEGSSVPVSVAQCLFKGVAHTKAHMLLAEGPAPLKHVHDALKKRPGLADAKVGRDIR